MIEPLCAGLRGNGSGACFPRQLRIGTHNPRKPQSRPSFPRFHQSSRRVLVSVLVLMVIEPKFQRRDPSRLKKRNVSETLIPLSVLKAQPEFKMVREERVELSTFGSGGRRSIQLSYSRKAMASIHARATLLNGICA